MKNLIVLSILSFLFFACKENTAKTATNQQATQEKKESIPIPKKEIKPSFDTESVDVFVLNAKIPDLGTTEYKSEKTTTQKEIEGMTYDEVFYHISYDNRLVLKVKPYYNTETQIHENKVNELWIVDSLYRNDKNVGVGTKLEDFTTQYPDYKIWFTYVSDRYIIQSEQNNIQYILNPNDYTGEEIIPKSEITSLKISDFKADSKIESVRIY
ncbi:hypothetical protein [Mesonia sp. K7]|uniref:hypothetical protein n=1 Tax=Mesonia sp. K7 TaxID=2218606 RepID=UPI000DA7D690|nr:hypothetical protein [Mesonia sp. K7]PZD78706.1 hypothetical protein DNG35_04445 [Mesonia sp. K7]